MEPSHVNIKDIESHLVQYPNGWLAESMRVKAVPPPSLRKPKEKNIITRK